MHPLDFEEFLSAMGDELTIPLIKEFFDAKKPLGQALHRRIMNDFRQYMLVGGMPQAVVAYLKQRDFAISDKEKKRILTLYRSDIAKYALGYESKVQAIFDSIPEQLSKKAKKYSLASINKNARMREYEDAFMWLNDGMIVNPCYNVTEPTIGLALSSNHAMQKLYMGDTGLLVSLAFQDKDYLSNDLYRAILLDKLHINEGMIMENIVAQTLRANGHRLYFYSRNDTENRENMMEIDFLINKNQKICPIEVKSSFYRAHSSLDKFRKKYAKHLGDSYILYPKDVMVREGVIHLPLYMGMFL
jgi:predicted AAA+ superfamily ATPase